jgi:hypothetical protein
MAGTSDRSRSVMGSMPVAGRIANRRDGTVPARCPPGATDAIAGREQAARPASHPIKDWGNEVNHHASAQSTRQ